MTQDELFICECHNTEHQLIFSYFDDEVYVSVRLIPEYRIWKRIINHRNLKTVPVHKEGNESNDKVVYKILLSKEGKYVSPYRKHSYQLDCDTVDEEEADIKKIKEKNKPEFRVVGKRFLHSIRTLQAAQVQATKIQNQVAGLKNLSSWTVEIHKAIIPEGTKYYEGRNSDICSKTLRVLSEVIT